MQEKKFFLKKLLILVVLLLIQEIVFSLFFMKVPNFNYIGNLEKINLDNITLLNIEKVGDKYKTLSNDPGFLINFSDNKSIASIIIKFKNNIKENLDIQVFYSKNENFTEESSVISKIKAKDNIAIINFKKDNYTNVRIDIGNRDNILFYLDSIFISDENQNPKVIKYKFSIIRIILFFIISYYVVLVLFKKINNLIEFLCSDSIYIDMVFMFILTIIFFSVMPIITFDSLWYHYYLEIFNGNLSIDMWDPSRGLPFPLLIYISSKLFGLTTQGITITMYLFYCISIFFCIKIMNILIISYNCKKIYRWIVLTFLIFLNPIFLGYYHMVLTEFFASTCFLGYIYIRLKDIIYREKVNNNNNINRFILFIFLSILLFFTKQMFLILMISSYLTFEFIDVLFDHNKKKLILSIFSLCFMIILVVSLNNKWNDYIDLKNSKDILGRKFTNSMAFSNSIIGGLRYFNINKEKNNDNSIVVDIVNDNGETLKKFVTTDPNIDKTALFLFYKDCFIASPKDVIKGYLDNYLVISNIYRFKEPTAEVMKQKIDKTISFTYGRENYYLACTPNQFLDDNSVVYDNRYNEIFPYKYLENYNQKFSNNIFSENIFNKYYIDFANLIFSFISISLIPILILSIIFLKKIKFLFRRLIINIILALQSFLYMLGLSILGLSIDRYAFPLYTLFIFIMINCILILIDIIKKNNN